MKILNFTLILLASILLSSCTKQIPQDNQALKTQIQIKKIEVKKEEIKVPKYELSKNEKEFLSILKEDKYASLCSLQDKFIKTLKMNDSKAKSELIKDLFIDYTNNLANSCIDHVTFQQILKGEKYKERKQHYEVYNVEVKEDILLKSFNEKSTKVSEILDSYAPKHPDFFKMISKLDTKKLTEEQYNKLRLNIERIKLLKDYDATHFVEVNIPSYNFNFYENGKLERSFGTVVGEKESQTPVLSSKLSYFIINPQWNIPDSIAKSTIIPRALKDKNYLRKKNIVIREKSYDINAKKVSFNKIKWNKYLKENVNYIPYKFIQLPSTTNGMGRVKYMFANDYAVYLHDTIGTWRFKDNREKIRFASHGCVRLEHPISFLKHLTTFYTPQSYKDVRKTYLKGEMDSINLTKRVPLHITYLTADINSKGELKFFKDVYEYDEIQKLNFIPFTNALEIASIK